MKPNKYIIFITVTGVLISTISYLREFMAVYFPAEIIYTVLAAFFANILFKDITEFLKRRDEFSIEIAGDTNIQHNYSLTKDDARAIIDDELAEFRESLKEGVAKDGDIEKIVAQLKESVFAETSVAVINRITEKINSNYKNDEIRDRTERTIRRLSIEIQNLTNRSSLNLAIGVIISVLGFAALTYFVFTYAADAKTPTEMAVYFMPRASLVVFVEIFAYFFLRLYKDTLAEIKYFQNELTNVEIKYISLSAAVNSGNEELLKEVVSSLSKTERNFVLNKGQSTVEIENNRSHNSAVVESIKSVSSVFNGKSK